MGKKQHTPAEVAAEKAAKKENNRRLAELEAEKRRLLARMELEEDEQEFEHEINVVRRLSDVRFVEYQDFGIESEGKAFDLNVDSSGPAHVERTDADEKKKPVSITQNTSRP